MSYSPKSKQASSKFPKHSFIIIIITKPCLPSSADVVPVSVAGKVSSLPIRATKVMEQFYFFMSSTGDFAEQEVRPELSLKEDPFKPLDFSDDVLENKERFKERLLFQLGHIGKTPTDSDTLLKLDPLYFRTGPEERIQKMSEHWTKWLGFMPAALLANINTLRDNDMATPESIRSFIKTLIPLQDAIAYRVISLTNPNQLTQVREQRDLKSVHKREGQGLLLCEYLRQLQAHIQTGSKTTPPLKLQETTSRLKLCLCLRDSLPTKYRPVMNFGRGLEGWMRWQLRSLP